MKHLDNLLKGIKLFPIIVFGNNTTLKNVTVENYDVIQTYELKDYIEKTKQPAIYTAEQVDLMYRYLGSFAYKTEAEKQDHINRIKRGKS